MHKQKHLTLTFGIGILAVITLGAYFGLLYKKAHTSIPMQCGVLTVQLPPQFVSLARPQSVKILNKYGCYVGDDGCTCAKVSPEGLPMVFGISRTTDPTLKVPTSAADQKTFLTSLGQYVKAGSTAGTQVTIATSTFKGLASVEIKSIHKDAMEKLYEARDIYFVYNNNLININFNSDKKTFDTYWQDIEQALQQSQLVK